MSYDLGLTLDEDYDDYDRQPKQRLPFDFQCMLGRLEVDTPLSLAQVRRARALHTGLVVRIPHAYMQAKGPYKGIITGGSEGLDVELRLLRENLSTGDYFQNDAYQGIGRVFPLWYQGDHDEHPKLQFLVFDPREQEWYLSCGGMRYCWWCQSDREFEAEMRLVDGFGRSLLDRYDEDDWY